MNIKEEFYLIALEQIYNGAPLYIIEEMLVYLIQQEQYLKCAGVYKALEFANSNTMQSIEKELEI
jgi:hypothetical protein